LEQGVEWRPTVSNRAVALLPVNLAGVSSSAEQFKIFEPRMDADKHRFVKGGGIFV
jgi:hypothetical protein